jgi:ribosomal protein S18 acetylase RimI-like enzyme
VPARRPVLQRGQATKVVSGRCEDVNDDRPFGAGRGLVGSVGLDAPGAARAELAALVTDPEVHGSEQDDSELLVVVAVLTDDCTRIELHHAHCDSLTVNRAGGDPFPDLLRRDGAEIVERIHAVHASGVIAERNGAVLRHATEADLPAVDELTVVCYRPIQESFVAMLGEDCYEAVRHEPELTWEERKIQQNRKLFSEHPDWLWVLDEDGVFGFVSFWLVSEKQYGHIDNNGVRPDRAGQGWATYMYRHVLQYFRAVGLRYAHVDTGLDDAHVPARRAYEAVGFDREVPIVEYWQDLSRGNPGSEPLG